MNANEDGKGNQKTFDVYVGHVPKSVNEPKLYEVFSKFGEICDIFCRYTKGTYGYAIVKFRHKKDADRINDMGKVSVDGNDMEVSYATRNQSGQNGNGNNYIKPPTYPEPSPPMLAMRENYCMQPPMECGKNAQKTPITVEVLCTSVESAVSFYGCPIFRYDELQSLSDKMNSICPNLMRFGRKPSVNKIYGALYGEDLFWYRCNVIQNTILSKPGMCIVQYIDYGNVEEVSYTNMVELPEPIKRIAMFAMKCVLSNLLCNSRSHSDVSYLHHLVNQRMSLRAIPGWGVPQYNVLKCSCNGIDVISELVRNGFAVYKNQTNPSVKSAPNTSTKSDNSSKTLKTQADCRQSKKMNGILPIPKKSNGNIDRTNNHSGRRSPSQVLNSSTQAMLKSRTTLVTENGYHHDFAPKTIIKRGSQIANAPEENKVKDTVNQLLKIDCVLSNLKLVNNVRALVSVSNDVNLITSAVNVLLSESDVKPCEESVNNVKEAYREYNNVLNEIKNCQDQALLNELKGKRELQKSELCSKLETFLQTFDTSILEKQKAIQQMITDLESNSNAWMNVYLPQQPATVEELLTEYNKAKESKWEIIQKAREKTNKKHEEFMDFLTEFQKEFSLNKMDGTNDHIYQLSQTSGKKGSYAVKFEEAVSNLGSALEEEMKTCTVSKGRSCVSVIQCILDKIDVPKEKVDTACDIFQKYKALYADLQNMTDLSLVFHDLAAVKEEISVFSSLCENKVESEEKEDPSLFEKVHNALFKEDVLLEILAKASSLHYPELVLEHPELNLSEYQSNSYLVKYRWKTEYFPGLDQCSRIEPSYVSKFAGHPVVLKEFAFENNSEKSSFTRKAIVWNEIKSKSLAKVQALFNKDETTMCAILPHVMPTLLENPIPISIERKSACGVLQQILVGLKDIHSRGMAHGAVHPLAVLRENEEVLLDFNYDLRFAQEKLLIKGINFQIPTGEEMCKSADMYGFGCLVLWILFPNLSFTSTEEGVPNLFAFQSILEELLSAKDFSFLAALLNSNPDLRPSSRMLLSSGFLKDLRIICDT